MGISTDFSIATNGDVRAVNSFNPASHTRYTTLELHAFLHGKRAPRLDGLHYGVLGLGDSSYEHFCQTAKDFASRLEALGGKPLLDPQYCDVHFQKAATAWSDAR